MGRFTPEAPPSPLTWRQKLRAVVEAAEALVYLHSCKPQILHRDFKEANILLDGSLHAYLSDTGFAKAAQRGGAAGGATVGMSTTVGGGALGYTPGYADEDVLLGKYSESSDGFAVGRTLLAVLTRRSAIEIIDRIEEAHDADFEELDAEKLGEAGAGWTAAAAEAIRTAYLALCHTKKRKRAPLAEVLPPLRALVEAPGGGEAAPSDAPSSSSQAALPAPTPLSVQVRGMRQRADDPALSIQRNVSDAFDGFMRRVGKIAEKKVGKAVLAALKTDGFPAKFVDQINWCRTRTILDPALAESLHRLRVWRNAATHHEAARWAKEGPASAEEASQLISVIDGALAGLESA